MRFRQSVWRRLDVLRVQEPSQPQASHLADGDRDRPRRRDDQRHLRPHRLDQRMPSTRSSRSSLPRHRRRRSAASRPSISSSSGTTTAPPFDESLLAEGAGSCPTSQAAIGGVGGEAQLIGKNGKAIVFGGAPNLGFSVDPTQPEFNSLTLVGGRWPKARRGRDRRSRRQGRSTSRSARRSACRRTARSIRCVSRASSVRRRVRAIGGATLAGFDLPTAQHLFDKRGKLDQIRVGARSRASRRIAARRARSAPILPPGTQVKTRQHPGRERRQGHRTASLSFLQTFLLSFGGHCAVRRRLRDRQLALDHDRAAHARVRDPAHARRLAAAGAATRSSSRRW